MLFEDILNIIRNPNQSAKVVFRAIVSGLEYVHNSALDNRTILNELHGMFSYITDRTEIDNSSTEVVGARGGEADLNARITAIEGSVAEIFDHIESNQPVIVKETRTESIAFGRTVESDDTLLPSESYIKTDGVEGVITIEILVEYIDGKKIREISRTVKSRVEPVNEVYVQGTKAAIANRPIRYIRFVGRLAGKQEGRWVELEVYAGTTKLTNANTVTMVQNGKTLENGTDPLYDGVKQYWSSIVKSPNPYVQVDLGSARQDLSKATMVLHPGSSYELINIEVSSDNKTFYRVYNRTNVNNATVGQEISIDMNTLYRMDPLAITQDTTAVNSDQSAVEVPVGGTINVRPAITTIYTDAGSASVRVGGKGYGGSSTKLTVGYIAYATNTSINTPGSYRVNANTWVQVGGAKPVGTFVTIYGVDGIGWFRADDL